MGSADPDLAALPIASLPQGPTAGTATAVVKEYAPASGKDGHFVAFSTPGAQADLKSFFGQLASGATPVFK